MYGGLWLSRVVVCRTLVVGCSGTKRNEWLVITHNKQNGYFSFLSGFGYGVVLQLIFFWDYSLFWFKDSFAPLCYIDGYIYVWF